MCVHADPRCHLPRTKDDRLERWFRTVVSTSKPEHRPEHCSGTVLIVKIFTVPAELWLRLPAALQDTAKAWFRN